MDGAENGTALAIREQPKPRAKRKPPERSGRTLGQDPPTTVETAAHLLARGHSYFVISKQLHSTVDTVKRWEREYADTFHQAALALASPEDAFRSLLPLAVRAIRDTLEIVPSSAEERGVQLRAAHDVADRLYGKPIQRAIVDSRSSIRVEFAAPAGQIIDGDAGPAADSAE